MYLYVNICKCIVNTFFFFANVANHECSGNHALEGKSCYCIIPTYSFKHDSKIINVLNDHF